jgi:hypothetical protein
MTATPSFDLDLAQMVSALIDDELGEGDRAALAKLLAEDPAARAAYYAQIRMHAQLAWNSHPRPAVDPTEGEVIASLGMPDSASVPPILSGLSNHTFSSLSSGWPLAYLVATIIMAVGLVGLSFTQITPPNSNVRLATGLRNGDPQTPLAAAKPNATIVGRITDMADCVWAETLDRRAATGGQWPVAGGQRPHLPSPARGRGVGGEGGLHLQSAIHLGDSFTLQSGLLEITYDTGARVILQGPVTYEIESAASGYLTLGKLTARVEKGSEGKVQGPQTDLATGHEARATGLFAVRTPTALVTDLGTEFGVEVLESGITESHVFQGRVQVQRKNGQGQVLETVQLVADEGVRVQGNATPLARLPANRTQFVRAIQKANALGLLARYKFNSIVGDFVLRTPDDSGNHRPGALWEMTQANLVAGKVDKALEFNVAKDARNQRVSVPWSPVFDFADESFTIAMWLNRRAAGFEEHETIVHKEGGGTGGYSILRERDTGRLVFRARDAKDKASPVRTNTTGDDAPEGVWVHFAVVCTYDAVAKGYDVTLYRNGVEAGSARQVPMATIPLPLEFGGLENGWGFRGALYDAQIYRRALNANDVKFMAEHPGELPPAPKTNESAAKQEIE